jgi:large subunit ribosomal protein L25
MKLTVKERASERKSDAKKIRRAGDIPAVVYAAGQASETVMVAGEEFRAALRKITQGMLPTTVFELTRSSGAPVKALVKDIQYHRTSYQIVHLDFQVLLDNQPVHVKIPVECVGQAECAGIKLGGFLRQVLRTIEVECLPKDIPSKFLLDVRELSIFESKKISDLTVPEGIRVIGNQKNIVAIIAKH